VPSANDVPVYKFKGINVIICFTGTGQRPPPDKNPPNIEIIIQAYYIYFILMVILKDILKN
jgi:hypothetical protein